MGVLSNYEPKEVLYYFEELTKIPRETFKCEKVADYCVEFAKEHNLEYYRDQWSNVLIRKPGTAGYEDAEPVIIQGHLDMVCVKTLDSNHNFDTDALEIFVEDGKIGAKNTSLGGDDGIAVAYGLAVLASTDMPHPPIEAFFTADEEQEMRGAKNFDYSQLKGKMLLNIDGEEEGTLVTGCAGGFLTRVHIPYERTEETGNKVVLAIKGLLGGHSGGEIQCQRANANKTMGRMLYTLSKKYDFNIINTNGGVASNVIAQFNTTELIVEPAHVEGLIADFKAFEEVLKAEYGGDEAGLTLEATDEGAATVQAMDAASTDRVVFYLYGAPDEVQAYDRVFTEEVETSLNTGIIKTEEDNVYGQYQVRSSVKSKLDALKEKLTMWAEFLGGWIETYGDYPAWAYKADSKIRPIMVEAYKDIYGTEPSVGTTHGGLEGGMFAEAKPELDSVCFGPNMQDVHSVGERIEIESIERTWKLIKEVLKRCK